LLYSMTAFGRGQAEDEGYSFTVELRTLNHRFCDIQIRLPRKYAFLEDDIRKKVSRRFSRGRIELTVLADETLEKVQHLTVDLALARTYKRLATRLKEELDLEGELRTETLLGFRDIFVFQENEQVQTDAWQILEKALEMAIEACLQMRFEEGRNIELDFRRRLDHLNRLVEEMRLRAPEVIVENKNRLQERVQQLLEDTEVDEARLMQEVVFFAEKADITEELVRLQSHLQQFHELLEGSGVRGRELEFLLQEMLREINTIGAKASDVLIGRKVIKAKTELERLREQVQNVE